MRPSLVWILGIAALARAEEPQLRWALSEGDHRIHSRVAQQVSVTPPGRAPTVLGAETEETWKASIRAAGESWDVTLTWERLRVRESEGAWKEITPDGPDEGWPVARLRALRALSFELVLAPDGRVRSCDAQRLDLAAPPDLPDDVHAALYEPAGLAKALRAMWVRLPQSLPKPGEPAQVEDEESGVRRLRTWQMRPEDELDLTQNALAALRLAGTLWGRREEEVLYVAVFPDGAPEPPRDDAVTISPDVVSVTWEEADECGAIDADVATGLVKGVCTQFRATLRIQVRAGEVIESWPGEITTEHVFRLDPPQ